ncbi:MAG TPA: DUF2255 family protein [Herpetosiphonaceae bacterium]
MRGAMLHAAGDVRYEERPDPLIIEPTDAIVRTMATCICGSDLWPYRGIDQFTQPWAIGHEYCGIVEQVGSAVTSVQPGQFVIGGFVASDNTCPTCRAGVQTNCQQGTGYDGCQVEEIEPGVNDQIGAAYRTKYRRYAASIIDAIMSPQARAATITLVPR